MKALTLTIASLATLFGISVTIAEEPQKHFGYFKVGKGQIGETCPELKEGQQLTYKVKSNKRIQFNFHYHQGEEVSYPVKNHETQLIEKTFTAEIDETYCLMWTGLEDHSTVEMEYFIQDTVHEAMPVVTVAPNYPREAADNKVEGYVMLSFDIEADGKTSNIAVIEEEPIGVFSQMAIEAMQKWFFKPKIINAQPVKSTDYSYKINFTL